MTKLTSGKRGMVGQTLGRACAGFSTGTMAATFAVAGLLLVAQTASAQDTTDKAEASSETTRQVTTANDAMNEPLVTDRPDFTESTEAVPTGLFQIEAGYTFTYDRVGKSRTRSHTAPELLLRIGVVENLELRIGWEGYVWGDQRDEVIDFFPGEPVITNDNFQGASDLSFGAKYKFGEQDGLWPHFGVIAGLSAPSGSGPNASDDVEPELVLLWAYDLSDSLALAGNVGFSGPVDGGGRFFETSASINLGLALTERLGSYVEYFGTYADSDHGSTAHTLDGGFTYLINNNLQIDWRIGAGLNEEADDFFTGVGFAWRF